MYMAEEDTDQTRTLPKAIIGGAFLIVALYLPINAALLRMLPMSVLAASKLPVANAAGIVLPRGGAILVTVISLLTILSILNCAPTYAWASRRRRGRVILVPVLPLTSRIRSTNFKESGEP